MQTARMMMVVVERPDEPESGVLVPPLVERVNEVTGMPAMFPLASRLLRLFWLATAAAEPGAAKEVIWRLATTDPKVMDLMATFLTATPAELATCWRKDR